MKPRTPRERERMERHSNALEFAIRKFDTNLSDTAALRSVQWFAYRSPFTSVQEAAQAAIRKAGEARL